MSKINRVWISNNAVDNSKMNNLGAYTLGSVDASNFTVSELITSVDMTTTNFKVNGIANISSLYFSSGNVADFTTGNLMVTGDSTVNGSAMFVDGSFSGNVRIEGTLSSKKVSTIFDQLLIDQGEYQSALVVNRASNTTPVIQINGQGGQGTLLDMSGHNSFTSPAIKIHQENTGEDLIISGEDTGGGLIGATGDLRIYNNSSETVLFTSAGDMSAANSVWIGGDASVGDTAVMGDLLVQGNINGRDTFFGRLGVGTPVSTDTVVIEAPASDKILVGKKNSSDVFTLANDGAMTTVASVNGVDASFSRLAAGIPNTNHALSVQSTTEGLYDGNAAIVSTGYSGINLTLDRDQLSTDHYTVFSDIVDSTKFFVGWNGDMTCNGNIRSFSGLKTSGDSSVDGNSWVGGDASIVGDLSVLGNTSISNVDTIEYSGSFLGTSNLPVTINYIKYRSGTVQLSWDATTIGFLTVHQSGVDDLPLEINPLPLLGTNEVRRIVYGLTEITTLQGVLTIVSGQRQLRMLALDGGTSFSRIEAAVVHYHI